MWQDAIRVAKLHRPDLTKLINEEYSRSTTVGNTWEEIIRSAQMSEESMDWYRAIDCYLELNETMTNDINMLE